MKWKDAATQKIEKQDSHLIWLDTRGWNTCFMSFSTWTPASPVISISDSWYRRMRLDDNFEIRQDLIARKWLHVYPARDDRKKVSTMIVLIFPLVFSPYKTIASFLVMDIWTLNRFSRSAHQWHRNLDVQLVSQKSWALVFLRGKRAPSVPACRSVPRLARLCGL